MSDLFGGNYNSGDFYGLGDGETAAEMSQNVKSLIESGANDYRFTGNEKDQYTTLPDDPSYKLQPPSPVFDQPSGAALRVFGPSNLVIQSPGELVDSGPITNAVNKSVDFLESLFSGTLSAQSVVPVRRASKAKSTPSELEQAFSEQPEKFAPVAKKQCIGGNCGQQPVLKAGGSRGPLGPSGSSGPKGPSTFTQDFNAVITGITSLIAPFAAAKAQKQQASAARGKNPPTGRGGAGGGSDIQTYALIGGGVLLFGGLVYFALKD